VRCRLRVFAHAPWGALARMLTSAFASRATRVGDEENDMERGDLRRLATVQSP